MRVVVFLNAHSQNSWEPQGKKPDCLSKCLCPSWGRASCERTQFHFADVVYALAEQVGVPPQADWLCSDEPSSTEGEAAARPEDTQTWYGESFWLRASQHSWLSPFQPMSLSRKPSTAAF